jgi:hypothetical protein
MSFRPTYPNQGYAQPSQPINQPQRIAPPAIYDQRIAFYQSAAQPYGRPQQYPQGPVYYYPQPPPYGQAKPLYPQESMMVVQAAPPPDQVYPQSRPPPPPDTSYQLLRPVAPAQPPAPAPLPPPKVQEKKPRLSQPPPHPPTVAKVQPPPPPPPPQVSVKAKTEELQVVLPQKPTFVPDCKTAPGCFDIVARGAFPQIRFTTEVTI